jgi:hypothetical protein
MFVLLVILSGGIFAILYVVQNAESFTEKMGEFAQQLLSLFNGG